ncbi:LOW QUALITY PROTEIN: hypothetical protein CFC21_094408 [Triticum aestivum]|uniref:F-box domain-containing protein n=2 Tax=Triticum aestivum TaxID=4565 RepID=A0A3B6QNH1_WHEAT|nr:LOW QUALITY PROTEIN: hypothetical protein CFC21_094408 [Triticum aestivum]
MQNPSRRPTVSLAGPPACSGIQGWADLPDELLHLIVARLGSFQDILGFAATCPSWRTASSSYPSKSTFRTKFPPLLIQPRVRHEQDPLLPSTDGCRELLKCKVIDPANPNAALHCQIPQETLENMKCIGSSYGNIIYYREGYCRIVDVFTGMEVSAPCLPPSAKCSIYRCNGILTAPVTSPNSHLIVSTSTYHKSYLFDWRVGSDSWSQAQLPYMYTDQIVEFNGQLILSDGNGWFHSVQVAPQLGLQEITTDKDDWSQEHRALVVCGDMLIPLTVFTLYRLDVSTEPATMLPMEKLDDWALFLGAEPNGMPLSCMSPEKWGGRSNTSYCAGYGSQPCTFHGLHEEPDPVLDTPPVDCWYGEQHPVQLALPLWLYPSMFYYGAGE